MGYVNVKGLLGDPQRAITKETEFLVDTGAFHTAIGKSLATDLGLKASGEIDVTIADKRKVKAEISLAYIRILDRESILPVIIFDVPKPLLGVTTLEGLGIKVDPVTGDIEKSRTFGVALL